ncbi:MAG: cupin domain-containing protein [Candidatus Marsarchaeota archaeon]|nr:cupin domain-containing protein [Candidatus Marsarchaeota archaeon]
MPDGRIVHINALEEGTKVKMPAELVFELRDKIGEIGKGGNEGIGIALARIVNAEPHWHEHTHEYYYVVSGRGVAHVDDDRISLKAHDWLEIPLKAVHRVESRLGIYVLAITSPPWSKEDHHPASEKRR